MTSNYPKTVAAIANDYLWRLRPALEGVPARERTEFLREIESHIYEAYQGAAGEDEVARILTVLRNLGEPADVVADRLPESMVRSGTRRSLPLYVLGGILLALFGIPLGFGGAAALTGVLVGLTAAVAAYYAATAVVFMTGAAFLLFGLMRMHRPELWDRLVANGVIHLDRRAADILDLLPPSEQGLLWIMIAFAFGACGVGMLRLGRYLVRGLRLLFLLALDGLRKFARGVRRKWQSAGAPAPERPKQAPGLAAS